MDYKKIKIDSSVVTRDLNRFDEETGNIYESLVILSKRSNQIAADIKDELNDKIREFTVPNDTSDDYFENTEQIEVARYYEQMPKPSILAIHEFLKKQIYYRLPEDSKHELV